MHSKHASKKGRGTPDRTLRRRRLLENDLPMEDHIQQDFEAAREYFGGNTPLLYPNGRIRWKKSTAFRTLMANQSSCCCLCRRPMDTRDFHDNKPGPLYPSFEHVIALTDGGRDRFDNLGLAHIQCNRARHGIGPRSLKEIILGFAADDPVGGVETGG